MGGGFEPPAPLPTHALQACSINCSVALHFRAISIARARSSSVTFFSELSLQAIADVSTDSGKLFSREHVDDTGATDARLHHDKTRMIARDFANDRGLLTKGMRFHDA